MAKHLTELILGGHTKRVRRRLRRGADPNAADEDGTTPLYRAAVQSETRIVKLLLEAGAQPNVQSRGDSEGLPLCAAVAHGKVKIVRVLLAAGADPNLAEDYEDAMSFTPLDWAIHTKRPKMIGILVLAGATNRVGTLARS